VFILLNEASHNYTRDDRVLIAGVDTFLHAPFVLESVGFLELFIDTLTPRTDSPPDRITRHQLRMFLAEITVDEAAMPEVVTLDETRCLARKKAIEIPIESDAAGPVELTIVAAPGTERINHRIRVDAEGSGKLTFEAPGLDPRERDTLGPVVLERAPKHLRVTGSESAQTGAKCPHGALASVRIAAVRPPASLASGAATSVVPPANRFPVKPTHWVAAVAANRYRPGTKPRPEIAALSLVLREDARLEFWPIALPAEPVLDAVVTLTGTVVSPGARLRISVDGRTIGEIDPPDRLDHAWPAPAIHFAMPAGDFVGKIAVELTGSGSGEWVRIRDVAVFGRDDRIESTLAP
jgi:hypothetical protein